MHGIDIRSSDGNSIANNFVTDNTVRGIYIIMSTNNEIYNNYFENAQNAYDNGTNAWQTTRIIAENIINGPHIAGNYWDDYTGADIDLDGIGETIYPINGGTNQDNAPLCQQTNYAPYQPTSPSPTDKAIGLARNIDLSWTGGDFNFGDTVLYDIYFGTSQNPPLIASNYSATTVDPGSLNYLTTYYWKIDARDNHGITTTGPLWSFTTKRSVSSSSPRETTPTIYNAQPVADAGGPYEWYINVDLIFDGSNSADDGKIVSYEWDFGDGNTEYGISPTYTYETVGNYIVTLTITDDGGKTASDTTYALIIEPPNNPPTTPVVTALPTGSINIEHSFTAVSNDMDNDTIQYVFDWGDETTSSTEYLINGEETTQLHTWDEAGKYTITITATDNKTETVSETTVLIDAFEISNLGLLLDENCDGKYDVFTSISGDEKTNVEPGTSGCYFIDVNGDNIWDYEYNILTNQLETYTEPVAAESSNMILSYILTVIMFIIIIVAVVAYLGKGRNKFKR